MLTYTGRAGWLRFPRRLRFFDFVGRLHDATMEKLDNNNRTQGVGALPRFEQGLSKATVSR